MDASWDSVAPEKKCSVKKDFPFLLGPGSNLSFGTLDFQLQEEDEDV